MAYLIKLPIFEGPFDLLFHLIEKDQIDIYDIPIARITNEYLNYIESMQDLDLEVGGQFLVMAATLMEIKARMLLPAIMVSEEEIEEIIVNDPREELVERLMTYRKYKELAGELQDLGTEERKIFTRSVNDLLAYVPTQPQPLINMSASQLFNSFEKVLKRLDETQRVEEIRQEKVTVRKKMFDLRYLIKKRPDGIYFTEIFNSQTTRINKVVTFLALLELIRLQEIKILQEKIFEPILLQTAG